MSTSVIETRPARTRSPRKTATKPASMPVKVEVVDAWQEDDDVNIVVVRLDVPSDRTRIELHVEADGRDWWRTIVTR